jgi:hypothetical protein
MHPKPPAGHDPSIYSTYSQRQCRCNPSGAATTLHVPGGANSGDHSAPPCFVPTDASAEPYLEHSAGDLLFAQTCFFNADAYQQSGKDYDWAHRTVTECLTPQRSGTYPQRTIFLIGDSHAGALAPGLMAAFDGAASVVWAAIGGGCGYAFSSTITNHFEQDEEHTSERISMCRAFNKAIDDVFASQLQPCDIVVVQHWYKKHYADGEEDMDVMPRYEALQAVVKSKGAKLVLLGDVPYLPSLGEFCVGPRARACQFEWPGSDQDLHKDDGAYNRLAADDSTFYMPVYQNFCDTSAQQVCNAQVPGTTTLAFFDEQHLTTAGAVYLWPFLCSFFADAGLL